MTDTEALVFVVDDDASLRTSLLESVGLRVAACASAQEFLRRPRPEGPSCLVLADAAPFEAATWASTFGPGSGLPGCTRPVAFPSCWAATSWESSRCSARRSGTRTLTWSP